MKDRYNLCLTAIIKQTTQLERQTAEAAAILGQDPRCGRPLELFELSTPASLRASESRYPAYVNATREAARVRMDPLLHRVIELIHHPFEYGSRSLIEEPRSTIALRANGECVGLCRLPQFDDPVWRGNCVADLALTLRSLPREVLPYVTVQNLDFHFGESFGTNHCRIKIEGLSPKPLYVQHSPFFGSLDPAYATIRSGPPAFDLQMPPPILSFSGEVYMSEIEAAGSRYVTAVEASVDMDSMMINVASHSIRQSHDGRLDARYLHRLATNVSRNPFSCEELLSSDLFDEVLHIYPGREYKPAQPFPHERVRMEHVKNVAAVLGALSRQINGVNAHKDFDMLNADLRGPLWATTFNNGVAHGLF